ncbi:hypothetical protein [Falsirhodobacter xinxiangensis]|uniref:hypothetical protein n=1 Tax=Falsirhodobacter xinxiangensis TaxID=2530049 RepID=UPI0010AA2061|nr:hypothetical protein [Rhodobacter xinxiangensis]
MDVMSPYDHANCSDPRKLKVLASHPCEWSERFRRNFDHVIENRTVTAEDYDKYTAIELEDDEALYRYLRAVHAFLCADGSYPDIDLADYA